VTRPSASVKFLMTMPDMGSSLCGSHGWRQTSMVDQDLRCVKPWFGGP
jgi:hypothetical protein